MGESLFNFRIWENFPREFVFINRRHTIKLRAEHYITLYVYIYFFSLIINIYFFLSFGFPYIYCLPTSLHRRIDLSVIFM